MTLGKKRQATEGDGLSHSGVARLWVQRFTAILLMLAFVAAFSWLASMWPRTFFAAMCVAVVGLGSFPWRCGACGKRGHAEYRCPDARNL